MIQKQRHPESTNMASKHARNFSGPNSRSNPPITFDTSLIRCFVKNKCEKKAEVIFLFSIKYL